MRILIILFILCYCNTLLAQGDNDLLILSTTESGLTTRNKALGGVGGSIGADFSAFSINPAGGGFYRQSDFQVNVGYANINSKSDYLGSNLSVSKNKLTMPSLSYVGTTILKKIKTNEKGERVQYESGSFSWSLGYNQLENYNRYYSGKGFNANNSFIDVLANQANQGSGTATSDLAYYFPYNANLAYNTNMMVVNYTSPSGDTTYYASPIGAEGSEQRFDINESGANNEIVFGIAGNIKNKIYLGASLTVPNVKYTQLNSFSETDITDKNAYFDTYKFNQSFTIEGSGIGAKLGVIFRVNDYVRVGLAAHTPVALQLSDSYITSMSSTTIVGVANAQNDVSNSINYTLRTPAHLLGSVTAFLPKRGFVSVDLETVNYGAMNINYNDRLNGFSFETEENAINNRINEKYKRAINLKIGVEYLLNKQLALRGGYASYGSPIKSSLSVPKYNNNRMLFSGGIGYRYQGIEIDATIVHRLSSFYYLPYKLGNETTNGANVRSASNQLIVGLGFRF
jgi:long-subunit fatty acid transport protein